MVNRWSEACQRPDTETLNRLVSQARLPLGPASLSAAAAIEFLRLMRVTFDAVTSVSCQPSSVSHGENFFQQICTSSGVAIIATDAEFRIQFWNPVAQSLLGGTPAERQGQYLLDLLPESCREHALVVLEKAVQKNELGEIEFEHCNPAGQPVYLAATVSPILDEGGRSRGLSIYVRNVTRRVQLQKHMMETQKISALGSMAGAVAHHFNNVLGGIITSIDFAQGSDNPATLRRVLRDTGTALSRANQLTLGLLAFAEGESTDPAAAEIDHTVRAFADELRPRLESHNILLDIDVRPVPLMMPVKRIRTVLDRLTANACEAMPHGGRLRIELLPDNSEIVLRVMDTGIGLSAEAATHLFEPFFTTKATGAQSEHIGLGLAVVHGIVRQLGGTASLTSQPSGGTACTIRLPAPSAQRHSSFSTPPAPAVEAAR